MLHASQPQPPPSEAILTALINEIVAFSDRFILVLDDFHLIDAKAVDLALAFLLENLPPQMHLVIATREDPRLPLARLRARGQLTELRAADLRFTHAEAAVFLNRVMGLGLTAADIGALEDRTEGWIVGLQLAALSLQGQADAAAFIRDFAGSHRFVLDYLVEEVLHSQSERVQTFLLRTAVLERLCGPLCDAVLLETPGCGQATLESIERANLFLIPLDHERRWYRYHHLFADLLRQQLRRSLEAPAQPVDSAIHELHLRASVWFEANGLDIEAFRHAAAAGAIDRAAQLAEGGGMPLLFRGAVAPVLNWLRALPAPVLDDRPSLWVMYASALLFVNQVAGVEPKLQAAEAALAALDAEPDIAQRDLLGHIASIRATVAVAQLQPETILAQSRRALEYLHPNNLPVRTATIWTLGIAHQLQGDRAAARQAFTEAIAASQSIGHFIITLVATMGLGNVQECDNELHEAAQTYQRVVELAGEPPQPVACEAHLGLARIYYEWNDLEAAQKHTDQSLHLARQIQCSDRFVASEVFLSRLKLALGDDAGAAALLTRASQEVQQHAFTQRLPDVAATQTLLLLRQGNLAAAAELAQAHDLPISQARVQLAQGAPAAALAALEPWRQQAEARAWPDERLKVLVVQAVAHQAQGDVDKAVSVLGEALALAEPGGFIRLFVDEGPPMTRLLLEAAGQVPSSDYASLLLAALDAEARPIAMGRAPQPPEAGFQAEPRKRTEAATPPPAPSAFEPLSQRELEVLRLVALGLTNGEIGERLFLADNTVKGHNRRIFGKLQVQRRTEAIARARALGLL